MDSLYFTLPEINPLLQCSLCQGYLVDPYTIKECMDTFCRTCILLHFEKLPRSNYKCPKCAIDLQPFSDIAKCLMPDRQLGDTLRALLPALDVDETHNEKLFYDNNALPVPKDLRLKLRLLPKLSPMRWTDEQGRVRLRSRFERAIASSTKNSAAPTALQIELCRKSIDPSVTIKQYPRRYVCVNAQLQIEHVKKYIETICQLPASHRVYMFFYDSCLSDATPLLLIKKLLFPSADRLKLYFSVIRNE